ncbi:pentapeptide repeat-containing protein [Streptomyces sp. 4F14]|uniref:pentapeptide repeat-containing protein n=1 Tax=Streptomyces sp. 4F14 TaxID=3394380 RepID=UPI003A85FD45
MDLDHRGTAFTPDLLSELLAAVTEPSTGRPTLRQAKFTGARFVSDADFSRAVISRHADFTDTAVDGDALFTEVEIGGTAAFDGARIKGTARFGKAKTGGNAQFQNAHIDGDLQFSKAEFGGAVEFRQARISGDAWFAEVRVREDANFDLAHITHSVYFGNARIRGDVHGDQAAIGKDVRFGGAAVNGGISLSGTTIGGDLVFDRAKIDAGAVFREVEISGQVRFERADIGAGAEFDDSVFGGAVSFRGAQSVGDISFYKVRFEQAAYVGPLACAGTVDLSEAMFHDTATIEVAANAVCCRRTRWMSSATLRLRHAAVDLSDAVVEYPLSVAARPRPFSLSRRHDLAEPCLTNPRVRVVSLRGLDAAHLVLNGVDLSDCLFAGTIHLDQLRLEGRYTLAATPAGLHWRHMRPVRWTPRRTLAEEHHWRASRPRIGEGWTPAPPPGDILTPAELAPVYRALRKSFEDSKHEPGAADFYYGEMEMRRHADDIPFSEWVLLFGYWLLSGYGMRASRAFGWLLGAMTTTVVAMMLWGLPQQDPTTESTGSLTGRVITMTTDSPDPVNPDGPYEARLSGERFDKSLQVVINSVIFRSSGQDLTTFGTYTEMTSRLAEPVLLGLGLLAIRSRIKR